MPQIRYYEVEETRRVKVEANSAVDAARIASSAFADGDASLRGDIRGRVLGNIEVINLNVTKEL